MEIKVGQKQKRAQARKIQAITNNGSKNARKQTQRYLKGPKNGGPTLRQRVANYDANKAREEAATNHQWRYLGL